MKTAQNESFSIVWKIGENFFHSMEKSQKNLPYCGKIRPFFPYRGNISSIVWKNRKNIFHTVETLGVSSSEQVAIRELREYAFDICLKHTAGGVGTYLYGETGEKQGLIIGG